MPADDRESSPRGSRASAGPFSPRGEPRAFLAAIVESSYDAIVGKTLDGVIRSWNPAAQRLFGYSAEEAVGEHITLIIPPERHHEERRILERIVRGERIENLETVRVAKDGRPLEVALTISPIRNSAGEIVGASKIARDVGERKELLGRARRNEEALEAVIAAAPVAISVMDADGEVVLWNPAATRIFGWDQEEVIGRLPPTIPVEREAEFREHLRQTLAGEPLAGLETVRRRRDGTPVEVALWSSVIRAPNGAPERIVSITADIGDRRRVESSLRESEERFRTLADNIAQLAWMAEPNGWIFWYNRRWLDYTGTTLDEMEGWGWRSVHHPDHVERVVAKYGSSIEAGEVWEDTFPLRAADGSWGWFLSRAIPIRDEQGNVLRWFGTNTDITERMEMEQVLREADRRKDEFLATLAHELRNPLAPVRTGIQVLRTLATERPDGPEQAVLETLERQTHHLVRLVDDLLDVSRITRGKVELRRRPVGLEELVAAAVETSRPILDAAGVRLALDLPTAPAVLDADPTRLAQVLANLLNNAAKYTPRGGDVGVAARRDGDDWVVTVRDTGVGIEPAQLEEVFDLFVQGEAVAGEQSGLGIGLTLVKALVELHGGRVEARSEGKGTGTEMVVRLPADDPRDGGRETTMSEQPKDPAATGLDILVADDNHDAADSLQMLLEMLGHEARAVYDGESALAAAAERAPDVLLLDLGMPGLDGYETARRLRREPWGQAITLIALTGWGQEGDRRRTEQAGFDHHLVKPADIDELQQLLGEVARGKHS